VLLVACSGDPAPRTSTPAILLTATVTAATTAAPVTPSESAAVTTTAAAAVLAVAVPATLNTNAVTAAAPLDLSRIAIPPGNGALVVVDAGHGGDEIGAAANGIVEKDSNLEMAQRVHRLLTQSGYRVLMTRVDGGRAITGIDGPGQPQGFSAQRRDLQARIDIANAAGAALFVSLHSNGLNDPSANGIETYYNSQRPFSAQSRTLAQVIQSTVISEMRRTGYSVRDRGALDDSCLRAFQGQCFPLFLLGPPRVTTRDETLRRGGDPSTLGFEPGQDAIASRATGMPGVLVELLFTSNWEDARLLADDTARETMARGVVLGIARFLTENPR
jgi:N-acetylmuramoyl-L-alanine amidase